MPKQTHHGKRKKYCGKYEINYIHGGITKDGVTDRQLAAYFQATYNFHDIANLHDSLGRTALHMAAACGRSHLCEWLILVAGADVNAKDWESGYTPLQKAIFYGRITTAVRLMKIGADLMSVDNDGLDAIYGLIQDRPCNVRIKNYLPAQVFVWGSNDNYTLGIGTNDTRKTPELMDNYKRRKVDITKVCINEFHSLFSSRCNRLWVCGNPQGGRLGISSKNHCLTPTLIGHNTNCCDIAISLNHTLVLLPESNAFACGQNDHYQLGISPYLKETATLKPVSINCPMTNALIGVGAGKYHSVFYSHSCVYVCGLNGGQLGLPNTPDNVPYVKVPTMVPINLKQDCTITSLSSSSTCIAFSLSSGAFYILYQYMFKKIAPKQLKALHIKQIATSGGSISNNLVTENCGALKVAILNIKGDVLIWQESSPDLKRCMFGLKRIINVSDIFLNDRQILFTSQEGEAFSGTIGEIEKHNVNVSKGTESGFQKFLAENESYNLQAKRIPYIFRGASITSDPKGKNFAVRQTKPNLPMMRRLRDDVKDPAKSQYRQLLEEASEEDQLHDITFKVQNTLFPAHKYIISSANSTLLDCPVNDGLIIIDDVLPVIFKEILMFIYTGSSDLFQLGPIDSKFSNCPEDPLKLFHRASSTYKLESLSENILLFKNEHGVIKLNKKVGEPPKFSVPNFNRESYPELYDIALKSSDGEIIKAHKCILVTRLEYFNHMLLGGWTESSANEVIVDFQLKYLESLLDYLYTNDASFTLNADSFENIGRLLIVADQLICETLKKKCEIGLALSLTVKNAASLLQISSLYNAPLLREYVMEFMSLNMDALFEHRVLEVLDDDILLELEKRYKYLSRDLFRNRIITPYSEYTISDEKILSSPKIPWPPVSSGKTHGIKNKEVKERQQKQTTVTPKKKATPPKKTAETTEIALKETTEIAETTVVTTGSPPSNDTLLNESDFPLLDYSNSRSTGSNSKSRFPKRNLARNDLLPRITLSQREWLNRSCDLTSNLVSFPVEEYEFIGQADIPPWKDKKDKQRKFVKEYVPTRTFEVERTRSPDDFLDNVGGSSSSSSGEETTSHQYQFKGWAVIPPLENPDKDEEITPMVSSFVEIIASEQKEKHNFFKMKTKLFALTQLEDKAIEELNQFYNASNVFDERITVQRVVPVNIAKPTWIKSHKKISY